MDRCATTATSYVIEVSYRHSVAGRSLPVGPMTAATENCPETDTKVCPLTAMPAAHWRAARSGQCIHEQPTRRLRRPARGGRVRPAPRDALGRSRPSARRGRGTRNRAQRWGFGALCSRRSRLDPARRGTSPMRTIRTVKDGPPVVHRGHSAGAVGQARHQSSHAHKIGHGVAAVGQFPMAANNQPNRRFSMIEPDTLFGDNLTRLQIQERRVKTGWNLVFTTQTDDESKLGLIDVWMKSDPIRETRSRAR